MPAKHPPRPTVSPLADLWDGPVRDLVTLDDPALPAAVAERHRIYSLLVMSLVAEHWNGNKRGHEGSYPGRTGQLRPDGRYRGGDYLGHNIACIAVDGRGEIIDFDFNHNEVFNSSVEHAESRLIRRIFSLAQIQDDWVTRGAGDPPRSASYSNLLSQVTIYTSLESCSQCSGIMALGSVKEVVFLQRDPGQSSIGNILRNLSPAGQRYRPPLPIPGDACGLDGFGTLDAAYAGFVAAMADDAQPPFFVPADGGKPDRSPSITSFLCTDAAKAVFDAGAGELDQLGLDHSVWAPDVDAEPACAAALTNAEALAHALRFREYVRRSGHRGTPHKL